LGPLGVSQTAAPGAGERLRELYSYRELVWNLTLRDLRLKYTGSLLGVAWSLLTPLLMMAIYTIVFSVFLKAFRHLPNYWALVIGGVAVINTMLMAGTERVREIGLKKAVGAHTRDIMIEVVTESTVIGLVGGLIGFGLGAAMVMQLVKRTFQLAYVLCRLAHAQRQQMRNVILGFECYWIVSYENEVQVARTIAVQQTG